MRKIAVLLVCLFLSSCQGAVQSVYNAENVHVFHDSTIPIQSGDYSVSFGVENATAGRSSQVVISVLNSSSNERITDLEVDHERLLHVFFVRRDLEQFMHVHAEDYGVKSEPGVFVFSPVFPSGGEWFSVVEWKRGGQLYYESLDFNVSGKNSSIVPDFSKSKQVNGYEVELFSAPVVGESELLFDIRKSNVSVVRELENYLGVLMHVAVWSEDRSFFTHAHSKGVVDHSVHGLPDVLSSSVDFPKPGLYKVWAQFKHEGVVRSVGFWVDVDENSSAH